MASCWEPVGSVYGCWGCDGLLPGPSILAFWRSRGSFGLLEMLSVGVCPLLSVSVLESLGDLFVLLTAVPACAMGLLPVGWVGACCWQYIEVAWCALRCSRPLARWTGLFVLC